MIFQWKLCCLSSARLKKEGEAEVQARALLAASSPPTIALPRPLSSWEARKLLLVGNLHFDATRYSLERATYYVDRHVLQTTYPLQEHFCFLFFPLRRLTREGTKKRLNPVNNVMFHSPISHQHQRPPALALPAWHGSGTLAIRSSSVATGRELGPHKTPLANSASPKVLEGLHLTCLRVSARG